MQELTGSEGYGAGEGGEPPSIGREAFLALTRELSVVASGVSVVSSQKEAGVVVAGEGPINSVVVAEGKEEAEEDEVLVEDGNLEASSSLDPELAAVGVLFFCCDTHDSAYS